MASLKEEVVFKMKGSHFIAQGLLYLLSSRYSSVIILFFLYCYILFFRCDF